MSTTMVQIRSVPKDVHRRLKARAALEGVTMSSYLLREIRKCLDRPTRQEVLDRLEAKPLRQFKRSSADLIRAERDA